MLLWADNSGGMVYHVGWRFRLSSLTWTSNTLTASASARYPPASLL